MNKKKMLFFVIIMLAFVTSCESVDPNDVDKNYVKDAFEEYLDENFEGVDYKVTVNSLIKDDERNSTGTVKFNDKFKTVCSIYGYIQDEMFDQSVIGSHYEVYSDCMEVIIENANKKINKLDFKIKLDTDYEVLANDIKTYIKALKKEIKEYKKSKEFEDYFSDEYDYFSEDIIEEEYSHNESIYIDSYNGMVILNRSGSNFSMRGEIELSEYLKLLYNNELKAKEKELDYKHNGQIKGIDY